MIPVLHVTLTILLQLIICHSGVSSLKVEISPKKPLFRVGDSQNLTCRMNQCSGEMSFSWRSLIESPLFAVSLPTASESTLIFKNVNKNHENELVCTGSCKGITMTKEASVTVRVYSFAKDPVISGHKNLVSGENSTLTCEISNVYPAERMTLEWVRGGEVVHTEDGEYGEESIQSNYTFTPEITNNNEPITCRVTLSLEGLPDTEGTRETTESMTVLCPPVNALISVSPNNPKENEFFKISCVSDSSPVGHMVLSKVLDGNETKLVSVKGTQVSVSYSKANFSHTGLYTCTTTNLCGGKTVNITVIVSAFAKDPVISGHKNLVSGKENSTLTCEISDVYPAERMTLEWVRGGAVVHREAGEYGKKCIQSNYTFTPEITNNNDPITCRVTLSLDGLPDTEGTRNTTVSMTVLCPPVNALISVSPNNPKENEFFKISCVSDSSPVGHMVLSKVLDGKETELVSVKGPQVSVSYNKANFSHTGLYICTTTNLCGGKTVNITVIVSAFAKDPVISGHKNLVSGKENSTLTCEISDVHPAERMTLEWVRGGAVVHREAGEYGKKFIQSNYTFTPEITNNNESITCQVTLSVEGLPETEGTRNTTVSMTVLSFSSDPTIKNSGLFLEGQVTNLTCTILEVFPAGSFQIKWLYGEQLLNSVRGNSSDKLQNLSLTVPFKPKDTDRNKTFTCVVSLVMGGLSRQKTVSTTKTVQYSPKNTTIDVRPHRKPSEGETVTISCLTDSSPEGHVTLKRELNGEEIELVSSNGTQTSFNISFTTVSHSGNYICEAVNKYGHQKKDVQITVQAPPKNITVAVYPAKEVQEGENITICCQSVSFPPSNITLRKLINGNDIYSSNGTFQLVNLTSNDSGLYQVIATNVLGSEIENFTLNVTSKRKAHKEIYKDLFEKLTSVDFIIPAIGVGILASVISSLGLIRKAKMKGAYEMSEVNTELP